MAMTSRERVRAVLNHQLPDRVPNGLGGCDSEGMHVVAYDRFEDVLGVPHHPPRITTFLTNAVFEESVIRAMDGDIIMLASPNHCGSPMRGDVSHLWKEQKLFGKTVSVSVKEHFIENSDGSVVWENRDHLYCPKGGFYFDHRAATDIMADFDVPDPDDYHPADTISDEMLRQLEDTAKKIYEETDYAICLGASLTDLQVAPGGLVGSMMLMVDEPDVMKGLLEKCVDAALKQLKMLDQAVGKYVDMLSMAHDFGDNRGVTIGENLWREIYKPYYKRLYQSWRSMTRMKINLHSCGSIAAILGDLIECGVHVINPIQTSAAGMEASVLKAKFGKDIVFYGGGYDAQLISVDADYDTVYQAVYNNIKVLGEGGNYIFGGVHNLPATLPGHHMQAMMDAFRAARDYETTGSARS